MAVSAPLHQYITDHTWSRQATDPLDQMLTAIEVREIQRITQQQMEGRIRDMERAMLNHLSGPPFSDHRPPVAFATFGDTKMNLSAAVMLFEENGVRPCRVVYDPDVGRAPYTETLFKCLDPSVKKDDLVIVTTGTRHGFTIAKVEAIGYADVPVDFEAPTRWGWVCGKFDKETFDGILEGEKALVGKVSEANANKLRNDIKNAMGLDKVSLQDVFLKKPTAIASPHGAPPTHAEDIPEAPEVIEPALPPDPA